MRKYIFHNKSKKSPILEVHIFYTQKHTRTDLFVVLYQQIYFPMLHCTLYCSEWIVMTFPFLRCTVTTSLFLNMYVPTLRTQFYVLDCHQDQLTLKHQFIRRQTTSGASDRLATGVNVRHVLPQSYSTTVMEVNTLQHPVCHRRRHCSQAHSSFLFQSQLEPGCGSHLLWLLHGLLIPWLTEKDWDRRP